MKRLVLRNFDDLVAVFPNMTLHQIICVYTEANRVIKKVNRLIDKNCPKYSHEELLERLTDALKIDAFLGTYLARVCCQQNGYMWR